MKTLALVLLLAAPVLACNEECSEYQGACACDPKPVSSATVLPSDEKPARSGKLAYEAAGIEADMPGSLEFKDAQEDREIVAADMAGKRAAGLR